MRVGVPGALAHRPPSAPDSPLPPAGCFPHLDGGCTFRGFIGNNITPRKSKPLAKRRCTVQIKHERIVRSCSIPCGASPVERFRVAFGRQSRLKESGAERLRDAMCMETGWCSHSPQGWVSLGLWGRGWGAWVTNSQSEHLPVHFGSVGGGLRGGMFPGVRAPGVTSLLFLPASNLFHGHGCAVCVVG